MNRTRHLEGTNLQSVFIATMNKVVGLQQQPGRVPRVLLGATPFSTACKSSTLFAEETEVLIRLKSIVYTDMRSVCMIVYSCRPGRGYSLHSKTITQRYDSKL